MSAPRGSCGTRERSRRQPSCLRRRATDLAPGAPAHTRAPTRPRSRPGSARAAPTEARALFDIELRTWYAYDPPRTRSLCAVEGPISRSADECVLVGDAGPARFLRNKRQRTGRTINARMDFVAA